MSSEQHWTLVNSLVAHARERGGSLFCEFASGASCTFGELDDASNRIATGLARAGIEPGDRIAIIAANCLEFLVLFLAVQKRRAALVPINAELSGKLLEHQIAISEPKMIVLDSAGSINLHSIALAPEISRVVIGNDAEQGAQAMPFSALDVPVEQDQILVPEPTDICLIMFTSGTSGPSKGVLLTQAHAYLFSLQQVDAVQLSENDKYYVCLPMFHVNALLMSLGACLLAGASAFVAARFSASSWISEIRSSRATASNVLGVMAEFILNQPKEGSDAKNDLARVMAVPVSSSWLGEFQARFDTRLIQVYGMTECNIVSFTRMDDPQVPGCTGPVSTRYFEVTIQSEQTNGILPAGSVGEICVRPRVPNAFMAGYANAAETTVKAWRGLWFHTGDAGYLDDRGNLHFVDRLGDCIRRRGENISSLEVEQVLLSHDNVLECAVVGVKVEGAGGEDEVKACITPKSPEFDIEEFQDWCAQNLPRFAVPRFVEIFERIPKTETGKIKKQALRTAGVSDATWDGQAQGRDRR